MTKEPLGKSLFSPSYDLLLNILRQARRDAGLTQSDVAKRLGRPQSFVSKCESGERRIDVVEFVELCRIYGVDPSVIIGQIVPKRKR